MQGTKNSLDEVVEKLNPKTSRDKGGYDLAVEVTGLKRSTLQSMVFRQQIPFMRLGRRLPIFSREDLVRWMDERRVRSRDRVKFSDKLPPPPYEVRREAEEADDQPGVAAAAAQETAPTPADPPPSVMGSAPSVAAQAQAQAPVFWSSSRSDVGSPHLTSTSAPASPQAPAHSAPEATAAQVPAPMFWPLREAEVLK